MITFHHFWFQCNDIHSSRVLLFAWYVSRSMGHDSKLEKQQWVHNLAKHFVEEMHLLKGSTNSPPCFLEVIGQRIFSIIAFFAKLCLQVMRRIKAKKTVIAKQVSKLT